jgi:ABC-2 type transport system permease protein
MLNVWIVAKRELQAYFVSPIAYVITAAFLVIAGYLFSMILYYSREATLQYLFLNMTTILLLIAPVLTMRLLAEERSKGTIELLLTSPVRDWEVTLGKYLASLGLFAAMLALTVYYPVLLEVYGSPDRGPILSGYLGVFLLGATLLALGLLTSSLTSNQIVAAVLGFVLILCLWLVDAVSGIIGGTVGEALKYLALSSHFSDSARGIIDTRDVIYALSLIVGSLFVTTRVLEMRRWR